jgi:beta-galactosidase/beta-glucuronidase
VRLTGVSRHEDSPAEGLAETRGTIRQDWNDLAALHTTLTRPVHYPQAASVYDAADRAGVLLVPEIPVWQMTEVQLKDPRLIANAQAMMREMIEQAGNHPSIFAWSVCNESAASTPGGRAYVQAMKAMIHKLDPGRFVTFADADVSTAPWTREAVMDDADFIMANAYFGTWSGQAQAVEPWLDFMDRTYPDKLVIISEFGWPGPFSADAVAADKDRIDNLANQMAAFERRPFVGGAIFWTYQDYKSNRNLTRGEVEGYVDHGLVDQNRQRKPSYAVWERRNRALDLAATWRVGPAGLEGFTATAAPVAAGRLPSYALIGYTARWRVVSEAGEVLDAGEAPLELSAAATLTRAWTPRPGLERATLSLEILTSAGDRADATTLDYQTFRLGAAPFPPDPKQLPSEVKP